MSYAFIPIENERVALLVTYNLLLILLFVDERTYHIYCDIYKIYTYYIVPRVSEVYRPTTLKRM